MVERHSESGVGLPVIAHFKLYTAIQRVIRLPPQSTAVGAG
jgi:hypothetical protein